MKKNVWIFNHYATDTFFDKGGRHYWFAKYLKLSGYEPIVFCANTVHGFDEEVNTNGELYIEKKAEDINVPYVFVKVPPYEGNGMSRIKNMFSFYINIFKVAKIYLKNNDRPDIIFASSVHPLTLIAGIQLAKKYKIKCICEIRDLWPESIVAYGKLNENSLFAKVLYQGENWIYKKADRLVFTVKGGKDYIKNRKWSIEQGGNIDLNKVYHINNGIDLSVFEQQQKENVYINEGFDDIEGQKIIYTGSIRKVNDIGKVLDTAKLLSDCKLTFCLFGDGEERECLEERVIKEEIKNVKFFGRVEKSFIPYIVSKASLLLLFSQSQGRIAAYGMSQNKMFDYLASGRPIISNVNNKYSIINEYGCGIEKELSTPELLAEEIRNVLKMPEQMEKWCDNTVQAARDYSFENHTRKLINIIEEI